MTKKVVGSPWLPLMRLIAVYGVRIERRDANGDVVRAFFIGRTVLYPLALVSDHCLSGMNIERAAARVNPEHTVQDDRVFVELRRLSRLDPSGRALHVGNADAGAAVVHAPDEFLNDLWLIPGSTDLCRGSNERRHRVEVVFE